jgi:hypothetical protein
MIVISQKKIEELVLNMETFLQKNANIMVAVIGMMKNLNVLDQMELIK